ncbi:outer membrane protein Tom13 [Phyllosticta capitalensis]|uniref:Outer membrane protein TOM13-domain-containing protein n=1 Tax=Phyllosticta capitalensis TaxID=121624 RepID=A0ABR1YH35_9PEZI
MASPGPEPRNAMSESVTIPSDSENYDGNNELSSSASPATSSSSNSPVILYTPPTLWGLVRGAAINLVLPFINGLMLGFGELFAHEIAFRLGWSGTKIFPARRAQSRPVGPGVEAHSDPVRRRRRTGEELDMYTAME